MKCFSFCLALGVAAASQANLLTNGSFESGDFIDNGNGGQSLANSASNINGWTVVNAEIAWVNSGNTYGIVAQDANLSLDLTGYHDGFPFGGVEQDVTTVVGGQYTLTYYYSGLQRYGGQAGVRSILTNGAGDSLLDHTNYSGFGDNSNTWLKESVAFVANDTTTKVFLIGESQTGSSSYIGLDNVSLEQTGVVPEPTSIAMLGLGVAAMLKRKRK